MSRSDDAFLIYLGHVFELLRFDVYFLVLQLQLRSEFRWLHFAFCLGEWTSICGNTSRSSCPGTTCCTCVRRTSSMQRASGLDLAGQWYCRHSSTWCDDLPGIHREMFRPSEIRTMIGLIEHFTLVLDGILQLFVVVPKTSGHYRILHCIVDSFWLFLCRSCYCSWWMRRDRVSRQNAAADSHADRLVFLFHCVVGFSGHELVHTGDKTLIFNSDACLYILTQLCRH